MKKTSAIIVISVLILILSFLTISCNKSSGQKDKKNQNDSTSVVETDSFYTQGYTKGTVSEYEFMYTDLIGAVEASINLMSAASITEASPFCTANGQFDVAINGDEYTLSFNLGFDKNSADKLAWSVVVADKANGSELINVALFNSKVAENTNLYIALGETKCKIPLEKGILTPSFPLVLDSSLSKWFSTVFSNVISPKSGSTKYEYMLVGGKMNRHFAFELDVMQTLKQLYSLASVFEYDTTAIDFILQSLLGINKTDVEAGKIPASTMSLEFETTGGYQSKAGGGSIKYMNVALNIEANKAYADTLFEGKACDIDLKVKQFSVTKYQNYDAPVESRYASYKNYNAQTFEMSGDFFKKSNPGELFDGKVKVLYDAENGTNTTISLELVSMDTAETLFALDYMNEHLNVILGTKNLSCDFDFAKLVEQVVDHLKNHDNPKLVMLIAYVVSSVKISDYKVTFDIENEYFKEVSGFTPDVIMDILENCTPDAFSLAGYLSDNSVDLESIINGSYCFRINLKETK